MSFKRKPVTRIRVDDEKLMPGICNNLYCNKVLDMKTALQLRQGKTRFFLCPTCFNKFTKKDEKPKIVNNLFRGLLQ